MVQILSTTNKTTPLNFALLFITLLFPAKNIDCQILPALQIKITFEKISSRYKIDVDFDKIKPGKLATRRAATSLVPTGSLIKNMVIINWDSLRRISSIFNPRSTLSFKQAQKNFQGFRYISKDRKSMKSFTMTKSALFLNNIKIDIVNTGKITVDGDSCLIDNLGDKINKQMERKKTDYLSFIVDCSVRMDIIDDILKQIEIVINRLEGINGPVLKPSFEINNALVLNLKSNQMLINNIEVQEKNIKSELEKQLHELDFNRLLVLISVDSTLEDFFDLKEELALLENLEIHYLIEKF